MGFLTPSAPTAPTIAEGPSAEEIRAQEEAKIREEGRLALQTQESRRSKLRGQLAGEEEGEVKRKRLFGE